MTLERRNWISANSELHIDLNGHKIVRKVTGPITEETLSHVFLVGFEEPTFARLTITDSTDTPGSISRNTSALSEEDLEKVFNYGLIAYMEHCTGDMTLYGGILDTKDDSSISYGSAIYCYTDDCTFKMYGGEILGGTAKSTIFSHGNVELYGGEIHNGCTTDRTTGAVSVSASGSLILSGDIKVYENTYNRKYPANIFVRPENLTIKGVFTGTVGILPWENAGTSGGSGGKIATTPTVNAVVGNLDNANIDGATIRIDGYTTYGVKLSESGTQILVSGPVIARTDTNLDTFTYDTLQEAIDKYPGDNATITMLSNWDTSTVVDKDIYLNLNGFTVADLSVNAGNTVYGYDTATDDYTVEDAIDSGSITAIKGDGTVVGLPADSPLSKDPYIKVTDSDGTTFHRLNLEICSVSLRPVDEPSIYYTCNFGGDEVIKSMVQSYGVALGAGKKPDFSAKTYTSKPGTEWKVGLDANGNPNNRSNGTLLSGVMRPSNTYTINRRNSSVQIYSQGYVILNDEENTKICGNIKNMSMADIFQGVQDKVSGIDSKWSTLDTSVQSSIKTMYQTFGAVMDRWNIPNILTGINNA